MPITVHSVGTSEVKIAAKSPTRTSLAIINHHATATIYIKFVKGVASTNGWPIRPYGSVSLSELLGDDPTQEVWCVSNTASTSVGVMEGYPQA